jgi:Tol biopolymer transport system component
VAIDVDRGQDKHLKMTRVPYNIPVIICCLASFVLLGGCQTIEKELSSTIGASPVVSMAVNEDEPVAVPSPVLERPTEATAGPGVTRIRYCPPAATSIVPFEWKQNSLLVPVYTSDGNIYSFNDYRLIDAQEALEAPEPTQVQATRKEASIVPSLAPNGRAVAFISNRSPSGQLGELESYVYVVGETGDQLVARANNDQEWYLDLAWDPTGTSLALKAVNAAGETWLEIVAVSGEPRTELSVPGQIVGIDWSPAGDSIAVTVLEQSEPNEEALLNASVLLIDVASGDVVRLASFQANCIGSARWSPSGNMLAWAVPQGSGWIIYVLEIGLEPGTPLPVTTDESNATMPAWSPDGQQLAYVIARDGATSADGGTIQELCLLNIVTRLSTCLPGSLGSVAADPVWPPDGNWVAYSFEQDNQVSIAVLNTVSGDNRVIIKLSKVPDLPS